MADLMSDLTEIGNCLLRARLDVTCDHWHITERAAPSLLAMAEQANEPRFRAAAEASTVAANHLRAARDALRQASRLCMGDRANPSQASSRP